MDGEHFDALARALATETTRRRVVAGLAGGGVGMEMSPRRLGPRSCVALAAGRG